MNSIVRFLALALFAAAPLAGAVLDRPPLRLSVVGVIPAVEAVDAAPGVTIEIRFASPVDPASVDAGSLRVFGRWSGPAAGEAEVAMEGHAVRFQPAEPFFAGERVTVGLSGAVRGADGARLDRGYAWSFWIRTAPGRLDPPEAYRLSVRGPGETANLQTYGSYAGDLDEDGWSDLTVVNERGDDVRVYLNDGRGEYRDAARFPLAPGTLPSPGEGADLDRDGGIDLVVAGVRSDRLHVLVGDRAGGFAEPVAYAAAAGVRCVAIADLDADGDDDVVTANRGPGNLSVFLNRGDGTLADPRTIETDADGETACAFGEANGDGVPDLFVGALRSRELLVLLGDGAGGLEPAGRGAVDGLPWSVAVGDVDGDGLADVVSANSRGHTASVAISDGAGGFRSVADLPVGRRPLAIDLGDVDGDGDLDMVTSNYGTADFSVVENDGRGRFGRARTLRTERAGSCTVLHDRDNDGDLDITGIDEVADLIVVFENGPPE